MVLIVPVKSPADLRSMTNICAKLLFTKTKVKFILRAAKHKVCFNDILELHSVFFSDPDNVMTKVKGEKYPNSAMLS